MPALLVAVLLSISQAAPAPAATTRYTVLMAGKTAGTQVVTRAGDEREVSYQYTDRGRGPELQSRLRIAPDGTIAAVTTSGKDYLKTPVSERFTLEHGRASWSNKAEHGERAVAGPAMYLSLDGTPAELGILARALLRHGGELALLPGGSARIRRVGERVCERAGEKRRLVQYAITGLDFVPVPIWLDEDGAFFALPSSWSSVIREGWESCVPDLVAAQDEASTAWFQDVARSAGRHPAALVIEHASLFDAEAMKLRPRTTVVVEHGRISAVGPDGTVAVPAGAEVVDAAGKTLLPGLWDMHVHITDTDGPLDIAAGITTVRDLANDPDVITKLRKAWGTGDEVGPRVIPAGVIDGKGPYAGPTKALASTVAEARALVADYAARGYPQIKIYSSVPPKLVAPIAAEAHARGMRVSGHVPAFMTATQAVTDGFDEIQHINMIFLSFWADTVKDTRTPLRFTAVAEKAALLDLGSAPVTALVKLLVQHHTVVDPTVSVFENMFVSRAGKVSPTYAAVADRLPATVRRGFFGGGLPVPDGMDQRYRDSFRALLRMVKLLHDRGVGLVAGSDALAGFTLQRELELYVEAGIPPARVLRLATLDAARVMKHEAELGSVAAGKKADLVLVDGNPLERISDVRNTVCVVKDGWVYDPVALERALGMAPRSGSAHPGPDAHGANRPLRRGRRGADSAAAP